MYLLGIVGYLVFLINLFNFIITHVHSVFDQREINTFTASGYNWKNVKDLIREKQNVAIIRPYHVNSDGKRIKIKANKHENEYLPIHPTTTDPTNSKLDNTKFIKFKAFRQRFVLELRSHEELYSAYQHLEIWSQQNNSTDTQNSSQTMPCHYWGTIQGDTTSSVAVSVCFGLQGLIKTSSGQYLVEPLHPAKTSTKLKISFPHVLYNVSLLPQQSNQSHCSVTENWMNTRLHPVYENSIPVKRTASNTQRRKRGLVVPFHEMVDSNNTSINESFRYLTFSVNCHSFVNRLSNYPYSSAYVTYNSGFSHKNGSILKYRHRKRLLFVPNNENMDIINSFDYSKQDSVQSGDQNTVATTCQRTSETLQQTSTRQSRKPSIPEHTNSARTLKIHSQANFQHAQQSNQSTQQLSGLEDQPMENMTRNRRSTSREQYVETLVVADRSMVRYHGREYIEPYLLSLMNIVAKLYLDASIGNSINIVVNRIIILQEEQKGLSITHHADRTLQSFCQWQQAINPAEDYNVFASTGIAHHDNSILLTRYDICSHQDEPCGTLGLAPVAGMCEPDRSCSIVQDIGLATAFTIAHEMGHNFGMQHDGAGNDCGIPGSGKPAKLMARQLSETTDPFSWSLCSEQYITAFLDSGRGICLNNRPPHSMYRMEQRLPGHFADADQQCKWQYDETFTLCKPDVLCAALHCLSGDGECLSNNIPAVDGTFCQTDRAKEGWCFEGRCVEEGHVTRKMDGQWGEWSSWDRCSRTCGGGVASSERQCDNPRPQHGGNFCIGERKRYRSCNIEYCPEGSPDFREIQCAKYDSIPFRGRFYKWMPFIGSAQTKPCALSCLADGYNFYTERAPKVIDGTRCYPDMLDVCINGECMPVGCDRMLGSSAQEDVCRVCNGDGSMCSAVRGELSDRHQQLLDTYKEVLRIQKGAVNIMIKEQTLSRNYLVLQTAGDGEYHINGAWTIDWPHTVQAAGTVFQYDRPRHQPESLYALGPINQDIIIHLLLQEENLGVEYTYHVARQNLQLSRSSLRVPPIRQHDWRHLPWTSCSQSCASGMRVSLAACVRVADERTVGDDLCQHAPRPDDKHQKCNSEPCPPRWSVGDWSSCTKSCDTGIRTREVTCVRRISTGEETLDQQLCGRRKPRNRTRCHKQPCPPKWAAGNWSQCSTTCGEGLRTRSTFCLNNEGVYLPLTACDESVKPNNQEPCLGAPCPPENTWVVGAWRECSARCGRGVQMREVACENGDGTLSTACDQAERPHSVRECHGPCLPLPDEECKDIEQVEYCPLVLQFQFCDRPYFHHMCCATCKAAGFTISGRHR